MHSRREMAAGTHLQVLEKLPGCGPNLLDRVVGASLAAWMVAGSPSARRFLALPLAVPSESMHSLKHQREVREDGRRLFFGCLEQRCWLFGGGGGGGG